VRSRLLLFVSTYSNNHYLFLILKMASRPAEVKERAGSTKSVGLSASGLHSSSNAPPSIPSSIAFLSPSVSDPRSFQPPSHQSASNVPDKQSLCIQTLVDGHVNSFIDLFYLTHRSDEDSAQRQAVPDSDLPIVQQHLCEADKALRKGDSQGVLAAYTSLADYFHTASDFKTSIYFYEKCLDVAESMEDKEKQADATLNLGLCHDALGNSNLVLDYLERHLRLARQCEDSDRVVTASRHLLDAYRRFAEEYERKEDFTAAVKLYQKMVETAEQVHDTHTQGIATYRLGVTCARLNDRAGALGYQQRYLALCQQSGDLLGEGAACAALAQSYHGAGQADKAIAQLERYLELAQRTQQPVAQVEACSALGAILNAQGDYERALALFERSFEIAKSIGDRRLVDRARVNLGLARGNSNLTQFMTLVLDDLPGLLNWKTKRQAFA